MSKTARHLQNKRYQHFDFPSVIASHKKKVFELAAKIIAGDYSE